MHFIFKLILILSIYSTVMFSKPIEITLASQSLLEKCEIYFDHNSSHIETIRNSKFKPSKFTSLNLGATRQHVWLKLQLINPSNQKVKKILLFKDPSLEHIFLYNQQGKVVAKTGVMEYSPSSHKTLFFYLPIEVEAKEVKTFFVELYNDHVPLGFSLGLDDESNYIEQDRQEQIIDIFLLGMIASLILYSLVMSLYLKEKSYLFYALYLSTLFYMMFSYLGFTPLIFSKEFTLFDVKLTIFRVYSVTLATALFAIYFLKIWQHKLLYWLYLLFIGLTALSILFYHSDQPNDIDMALTTGSIIVIYNFIAGVIVYKKGYKEARFYIIGFGVVLLSYLIMISDAFGWSYFTQHYYNLILWTTLFEAITLSLAFADRYIVVQEKLIYEITHKKAEIEEEVIQKTQQINQMLSTKELLLKELHHRVKNNLYIILSMVQMQGRASNDTNRFKELENRIHAISKSYDTLMLNQNLDKIEMKSYLGSLIEQIALSFNKESIEVSTTINATLPLSHAVYIGLIVNELLTNAYKYAFDEQGGSIEILLHKEKEQYYLRVKDNGKGFEPTQKRQGSLGLILVESLVKEQLRGKMNFESVGGVLFEVWF